MTATFSPGSRGRLTHHDLGRFTSDGLFDRLARAVCRAGCLPRKELYEAWEVARRTRRLFRGGRVVDVGGGHGLLAHLMLILDDTSPDAVVVDAAVPLSHHRLQDALLAVWPRLHGRVVFTGQRLDHVVITATDVVVSSHACGVLTDDVLARAADAGARVAVLPCCHDLDVADDGGLTGWMDGPAAVDAVRAVVLRARGYRVWTQTIPVAITPKNRLLIGSKRTHEVLADEV
ncbi:MAG: methyltransferase [Acidobacteriota bacterium]